MTDIKRVPEKHPDTETPTIIAGTTNPEEQIHKKMERMADRAAHKANKTQQEYDRDHNQISNT
jgi:hypothetical protein